MNFSFFIIRKCFALISVVLIIGNVSAQTQVIWDRHPANPVLHVGIAPAWDDSVAGVSAVIFHDNLYKMWYEGNGENGIGYATSPDGISWTKDSANPVFNHGPDSAWDGASISNASVVYAEGMYKMWYMGLDTTHDSRIGLATSPDGIVWTEEPSNPVLDLGPNGSWDDEEAMHPWVIYENGTFKMYYNGHDGLEQRILYAYSTDGMNWTRYLNHPMLEPGVPGQWDDGELGPMCVVNYNNEYHMWYMAWNQNQEYQIGHATSPAGLIWTKYGANPVFTKEDSGAGAWDGVIVAVPSVIWNDSICYMWYGGGDGTYGQTGLATGTLTAIDSENKTRIPTNIILHQNYPNPFNPITTIHYHLATNSFVTLKVYNILGKEIAILVNNKQKADKYTVKWDASNYPSGVYYYVLKSDKELKVRKMLLLK